MEQIAAGSVPAAQASVDTGADISDRGRDYLSEVVAFVTEHPGRGSKEVQREVCGRSGRIVAALAEAEAAGAICRRRVQKRDATGRVFTSLRWFPGPSADDEPELVIEARRLRGEGRSYSEIGKTLGIGYGTARTYTADVAPERARPPEIGQRVRATLAKKTAHLARATPRGGCGTPACHDPACDVPYGQCHCRCGGAAPIAEQTDTTRGYIKGEPRLFVAGHQVRGRTVGAREGGRFLRELRGQTPLSARALSIEAGVNDSLVNYLETVWGHRTCVESARAIAGVLARFVGRSPLDVFAAVFTRELVSEDIRGIRSRPAMARKEWCTGEHFKADAERAREMLNGSGQMTQRDVEKLLGLTNLRCWKESGRLKPVATLRVGALRFVLYEARDAKAAARKRLVTSESPTDKRFRDPGAAAHWFARHHIGAVRSTELLDDLAAAQKLALGFRAGTGAGRPRAADRQAMIDDFLATEAEFAEELTIGLRAAPASQRAIGLDVARRHPEYLPAHYRLADGSLDPRKEAAAANLVREAARQYKNSLQIAGK